MARRAAWCAAVVASQRRTSCKGTDDLIGCIPLKGIGGLLECDHFLKVGDAGGRYAVATLGGSNIRAKRIPASR
jgi:hypothetical protein